MLPVPEWQDFQFVPRSPGPSEPAAYAWTHQIVTVPITVAGTKNFDPHQASSQNPDEADLKHAVFAINLF